MQPAVSYEAVIQAITASQSPTATHEQRIATVQLFEQLKRGEVHASTQLAVGLLTGAQPLEVQLAGYQLLTFLVANRWDEYSEAEHAQLLEVAVQQLQRVAGSTAGWPANSKSAQLLATVLKRQGPDTLSAVTSQLLAFAQGGPKHCELVCIVLRLVAEEVTLYYDDIQAEAKRRLLSSLTGCLSTILPFLVAALEQHYGAAAAHAAAGAHEAAREHGRCVTAALSTAAGYCEWAPLGRLSGGGLLRAAAFLANTLEFRDEACEVLRQVAHRKQGTDEAAALATVAEEVAAALTGCAGRLLGGGEAGELEYEGRHDEFGRRLCDTMAVFGSAHLRLVRTEETRITFLQQMLAFAQHSYLLLSAAALPFWMDLLRGMAERSAKASASGSPGGEVQGGRLLPPDCIAALLELAGAQMLRGVHLVEGDDDTTPPFFDSFQEYKEYCVGYRSKLAQIVRHTAMLLPEQALAAAAKRANDVLPLCAAGSAAPLATQRTQAEALVVFVEATVAATADAHLKAAPTSHTQAVLSGMDSLLQQLIGVRLGDPYLYYFHAKGLEPFGRLLAMQPQLVAPVVQKVLIMLDELPLDSLLPPPKTSVAWKDVFNARQKVAGVLVSHAKAAPAAFAPHLESLAAQIQERWGSGRMRAGERNVLSEALLAVAQGVDGQLVPQVLEWILAPVRSDWTSPACLATLAAPPAFVGTYLPAQQEGGELSVGGRAERWALYHDTHLLFRALQRLSGKDSKEAAPASQPSVLAGHLDWAAPPLLQLAACMHALYAPAAAPSVAPIAPALAMSPSERALYLKQLGRTVKVSDEEQGETLAGSSVRAAGSWLRNIREVCYQSLGLFPTVVPELFAHEALRSAWPLAVLGDLQTLPHQHVRILLRHVLLPLFKAAPPEARDGWLLPLLQRLLPHMLQRLSGAWAKASSVSPTEGPPTASSGTAEDGAAAAEEIIASRLTVELTREHMQLIALLQDKGSGGGNLLEWLLQRDTDCGFVAIATAAAALAWRDSSLSTAVSFCRAVVPMALLDTRLAAFVGGPLLGAAIGALSTCAGGPHDSELLQLARDILVQQLGKSDAPRQVLLSLPGVDDSVLEQFSAQLRRTGSEKEQRNTIKKFLVKVGGPLFDNLAEWRSRRGISIQLGEPNLQRAAGRASESGNAGQDYGVSQLFSNLLDSNAAL